MQVHYQYVCESMCIFEIHDDIYVHYISIYHLQEICALGIHKTQFFFSRKKVRSFRGI